MRSRPSAPRTRLNLASSGVGRPLFTLRLSRASSPGRPSLATPGHADSPRLDVCHRANDLRSQAGLEKSKTGDYVNGSRENASRRKGDDTCRTAQSKHDLNGAEADQTQ